MPISFNKGATLIVLKSIASLGGRSFEPGDMFPWRQLPLTERRVGQMIEANTIGELTPESFALAMRRRPEDAQPPRGFTAAGLEALNISLSPAEPEKAPEKAPSAAGTDAPVSYDEIKPDRGYMVGSKKTGRLIRFDVMNEAGERLNPGGMLNGQKQLDAFIANLEADKARLAAEAASKPDSQQQSEGEGGGDPAPAAEDAADAPEETKAPVEGAEGYGDETGGDAPVGEQTSEAEDKPDAPEGAAATDVTE